MLISSSERVPAPEKSITWNLALCTKPVASRNGACDTALARATGSAERAWIRNEKGVRARCDLHPVLNCNAALQ